MTYNCICMFVYACMYVCMYVYAMCVSVSITHTHVYIYTDTYVYAHFYTLAVGVVGFGIWFYCSRHLGSQDKGFRGIGLVGNCEGPVYEWGFCRSSGIWWAHPWMTHKEKPSSQNPQNKVKGCMHNQWRNPKPSTPYTLNPKPLGPLLGALAAHCRPAREAVPTSKFRGFGLTVLGLRLQDLRV